MSNPPLKLSPEAAAKVQGSVVQSIIQGGVPHLASILVDGAISVACPLSIVQVSAMQSTAVVTQENWQGCYIPSAVDVFVTSAGAVFVLDTQCAALYKYNTLADVGTNTIAGTWGGPQAGTGNGKFGQPQRVVVDAPGNIYVADSANNRIVIIDTTNTWHYLTGYGTDRFNNPCGVAIDGAGNIYVADTGFGRIVRVRKALNFVQSPTASDWQPYKGYQALQYPFSVSIQPNVSSTDTQAFSTYVVDWANFQSFNASFPQKGTGPRLVELYGTAAGPQSGSSVPSFQTNTVLRNPIAVWAGMSGIYVTDQTTKSVAHFANIADQQPTYQNAQSRLQSPIGLCVGQRLMQL